MQVDTYVSMFQPTFMHAVLLWAQGATFAQAYSVLETQTSASASSPVFAGELIRVIRHLSELLQQLGDACESVGEREMREKLLKGRERVRRDIVFAGSLYT